MALMLKQSTAVDVLIGPFVDDTDGVTPEAALTLSQADIKLSKNGQTLAQKNDVTAAAADGSDGYYNCELDATDTNTVGTLVLVVNESGALAVRHEFQVIEENVYDAIYGASAALGTNVAALPTTAEVNAEVDTALADYDAPTKAEMDAAFDLISDDGTAVYDRTTDSLQAIRDRGDAAWTTGAGGSAPTVEEIADAVLDEALSGHTTAGTLGKAVADIETDATAILADSNELQADWANGGRLDLILDARAAQATADAIETDTQNIQSRLPAALVAGRMSSDMVALSGSTAAADNLEASALGVISGAAATGTLSTTQMTTDLSGYDNDRLIGRVIVFTSSPLAGEATDITDYVSASGLLTFTAITEAPVDGTTFVIV